LTLPWRQERGQQVINARPAIIRGVITRAAQLDQEWMRHSAGHDDPRATPWMPFPMFDFIALVAEALPEAPGDSFLEIGCGVGTRMLLAREIYGLDVHGFDRVPEYVAQARGFGLSAEVADALEYGDYGKFDLLWFNRPFADRALQRKLEVTVWEAMKPGAVVITANLEAPPPEGWWLILDDQGVRRWIKQKP
jgi:SAM-dependent methyltransferase